MQLFLAFGDNWGMEQRMTLSITAFHWLRELAALPNVRLTDTDLVLTCPPPAPSGHGTETVSVADECAQAYAELQRLSLLHGRPLPSRFANTLGANRSAAATRQPAPPDLILERTPTPYPPLSPVERAFNERITERTPFRFLEASPGNLEPAHAASFEEVRLTLAMFDPICTQHGGRSAPRPSPGVVRITASDHWREWLIELDPAAVWSDGLPVTSADYVAAIERALSPNTTGWAAVDLRYLDHAEEYTAGAVPFTVVGVSSHGPHRLRLRLAQGNPDFPYVLTMPVYAPIPRHIVTAHGKTWIQPGHVVSNGPFVLTVFEEKFRARLERNPRYLGVDGVAFAAIEARFDDSANIGLQARQQYALGEVAWSTTILNDADVAASQQDTVLRNALHVETLPHCPISLHVNLRHTELDLPFRQALMAIDRLTLRRGMPGAQATPTFVARDAFAASHHYAAPQPTLPTRDTVQSLLARSTFTRQPHPLTLVVDHGKVSLAEMLQAHLQRDFGLDVTIESQDRKWTSQRLFQEHSFDLGLHRYCPSITVPYDLYYAFTSDCPLNASGFHNSEYDDLYQQVLATPDPAVRVTLYARLQQLLNQEVPSIPLLQAGAAYLLHPLIADFSLAPVDAMYDFRAYRYTMPEAMRPMMDYFLRAQHRVDRVPE